VLKSMFVVTEKQGERICEIKFPSGCESCDCDDDWQCTEGCLWRENSWKYDEMYYYMTLARWANAGIDLNRIDDLAPNDFLKISILKKVL